MNALRLYIDTLRHARPHQLFHRLRRIVQSKCPWAGTWLDLDGQVPQVRSRGDTDFTAVPHDTVSPEPYLARAGAVLEGRFTFLNQTVTYPDSIGWHEPDRGRLWRFHLHYFDYAVDLGQALQITRNTQYWRRFKTLVDDWMADNPPARGDGWHPFTVSLRTVNWIRAYHLFEGPLTADSAFRTHFLTSLYLQARYLARNLEHDITGNHLIKNGKALLFAGAFFQGIESTHWFEQGLQLLVAEAQKQILNDGGHYERSSLYHAQVLADYVDALALIPPNREECAVLRETVQRMLDYLDTILHPDGTLPLFNDSALCCEPSPTSLFEYARELLDHNLAVSDQQLAATPQRSTSSSTIPNVQLSTCNLQPLTDSGYYIFRAADHFLILDCGPVCPDHLPPHAHCDMLSFELSVGRQRIITNSGTYQYEAGKWRDAFRGTAAHNTVQVNDEEQSAIWSSFRVGRRAQVLEAVTDYLDTGPYFRGRYAGFDGNRIEHTREVFLLPGPCWVFVDTADYHKPPSLSNLRRSIWQIDLPLSLRGALRRGSGQAPRRRNLHGGFEAQHRALLRGACPEPCRRARNDGGDLQTVTSRLHLHPQTQLTIDSDGVRASRSNTHLKIQPIGVAGFHLSRGWFSPDFGIKERCPMLLLRVRGELPMRLGFTIAPAGLPVEVSNFDQWESTWSLKLRCGDQEHELGDHRTTSTENDADRDKRNPRHPANPRF